VELPLLIKFLLSRKLSVYELPAISKQQNAVKHLKKTIPLIKNGKKKLDKRKDF
jgi:hypothetical protein